MCAIKSRILGNSLKWIEYCASIYRSLSVIYGEMDVVVAEVGGVTMCAIQSRIMENSLKWMNAVLVWIS